MSGERPILPGMTRRFIKRNGVLLATLAAYVAACVAFAVGLDLLIYQKEKRDLFVKFVPEDLFPTALPKLMDLVDQWQLLLQSGGDDKEILESIRSEATAIVNGDSSIYEITITRPDGQTLFDERSDKAREFNHSDNTLWIRKFSNQRVRQVGPPDASGGRHMVWVIFTTPNVPLDDLRREIDSLIGATTEAERAHLQSIQSKYDTLKNLPEDIKSLTHRFRWITYYIVGALTLMTGLFITRLVLPMRGVIGSIEDSSSDSTRFIRKPRTQLERLYNEMARDTVLARLQERQIARVQSGPPATGWEMIREACEELVDQNAASLAACVELTEEGPGRLQLAGRALAAKAVGRYESLSEEELIEGLADALGGGAQSVALEDGSHLWLTGQLAHHGRSIVATRLADPERPGVHWGIAVSIDPRGRAVDVAAAEALLSRFARIIRSGLDALVAHGRTLTRERDRASINISRNLGHDLTNIIATSKLELMTLDELLRDGAPPAEGPRREILKESLAALLNSTRFLQEVVNLYRAYAFLKEPVLELHDANDLIRDTVRLFQLSTSEKVSVVENLDPTAPRCRVDPRLLKLALFNLFSNAVDAIRRGPQGDGGKGTITIATRATPDGALEIVVHDSGPGIRNEDGAPANPEEIERIFALGWSVGREQGEGEGLGLNWVRTIIVDLHAGRITAENAPEGGASFHLTFPRVDS